MCFYGAVFITKKWNQLRGPSTDNENVVNRQDRILSSQNEMFFSKMTFSESLMEMMKYLTK